MPAAAGAGQRRDPTRIGQARPSHLVTVTGVGAILDLPSMSVVVRGLDGWNPEHQDAIEEPRLLEAVRRVLGQQVRALRHAPWDPAERDALIGALVALPDEFEVVPMRHLAWRMGQLIAEHRGLSTLSSEAVAAAEFLGARVLVSSRDESPGMGGACGSLQLRYATLAR